MWNLQTRMGRRPRCHSKPLREAEREQELWSEFKGITPGQLQESLLTGQSNSQLEKVCVPSKAQHSQGNPRQPEAKQPEKFIGWSCEEKPYGKEENKGERRFFCYFGLVSCNQLVPHV